MQEVSKNNEMNFDFFFFAVRFTQDHRQNETVTTRLYILFFEIYCRVKVRLGVGLGLVGLTTLIDHSP